MSHEEQAEELLSENSDLRRELNALSLRFAPIVDCYWQFRHLDHLLSDEKWLIGENDDTASLTYRRMVYEMWQAIRTAKEDQP